ncbi:efflux RND transporter periplasmic adaptor subunit [Paenibacillus humicola]|uniref:efflux RND transporter periplasmic adaptor subunit n=1 Tax=Paenibacillus humicola TaxID=3110540 RepID=UPI00237B5C19|nr:biotin/lipoyl-binding protein [Paenibacillus humicola]
MELAKEPGVRRRKRSIQIVTAAFMGLLLFFTLFSSTLQTLTLPKVITEPLASGSLLFTIEGSGTLQPVAEARLSNPAGLSVRKILVKEGDSVKKGQKLIQYDSDTLKEELEDETASLEKLKIELLNAQDAFIRSTKGGDDNDIRSAGRAIETLKLDVSSQERKIIELRDSLAGKQELTAPFDGRITQLNAVEGLASSGEPDVQISNTSLGYELAISADAALLSGLGISVGSKVGVEVRPAQERQPRIIDGTIAEMDPAEPGNASSSGDESGQTLPVPQQVIRIKVADPELKGGEQARVKIEKRSLAEGKVISSEAVHQDRDGNFVYKMDEQRGALGNVFIARKVRVQSIRANGSETMIQADSLYKGDLIILESSEPLQDGNRVRLQ